MGTTISKREPINIMDFTDHNHFLMSVFFIGGGQRFYRAIRLGLDAVFLKYSCLR